MPLRLDGNEAAPVLEEWRASLALGFPLRQARNASAAFEVQRGFRRALGKRQDENGRGSARLFLDEGWVRDRFGAKRPRRAFASY